VRRPYPTKGAWRLNEIGGVLHYRGTAIIEVDELKETPVPGTPSIYGSHHKVFSILRKALQADAIADPHLYAFYRCVQCNVWAAGSGTTFCSKECRNLHRRAQRAAREKPSAICETCGGQVAAERSNRRYCSNRCRQKAYRARNP
jgi:endogenous inhibitor of DNA gyrase (YacG/DUF329 family)